jgi:hypothetical protein
MEDGVGGGGEFIYSERGTPQGINTHFHFKEVSVAGVNSDVALVILLHSSSFPVSRISIVTSWLLGRSLCSSSHSSRVRPKNISFLPFRTKHLSSCPKGVLFAPWSSLTVIVAHAWIRLYTGLLMHSSMLCTRLSIWNGWIIVSASVISVTFTPRQSFRWIRDRNWKS